MMGVAFTEKVRTKMVNGTGLIQIKMQLSPKQKLQAVMIFDHAKHARLN